MRVTVTKKRNRWNVTWEKTCIGNLEHVILGNPTFNHSNGSVSGDMESLFVLGNRWREITYDGRTFRLIARKRFPENIRRVAFLGTHVYVEV
jgi:hypothetical protein